MDWRDMIEDPQIGEMYFDGQTEQLYIFKNIGDFPPEWINITPNCLYNHSIVNENCKIKTITNEYGVKYKQMFALRDIKEGEEIFVDYTKDSDLEQPQRNWKE